jgi:hypothetical protein
MFTAASSSNNKIAVFQHASELDATPRTQTGHDGLLL